MTTRIILADDHRLVRENLAAFLTAAESDFRIFEAGNLREAEAIVARQTDLDLIVLDLMMPGMNGLEGIGIMRGLRPDVPLAILSGSTRREDIVGALDCGAQGFIPKTIGGQALLNVLKLIIAGETYVPQLALADSDPGATRSPIDDLTAREKEVLSFLVKGFSNKKIAHELGIQEVTVKVHLQKVYKKLDVSSRTETVSIVLSQGWIQDPSPS
jgi:two-component system, NarL family, nitrate/nitrite response regulator NarL